MVTSLWVWPTSEAICLSADAGRPADRTADGRRHLDVRRHATSPVGTVVPVEVWIVDDSAVAVVVTRV